MASCAVGPVPVRPIGCRPRWRERDATGPRRAQGDRTPHDQLPNQRRGVRGPARERASLPNGPGLMVPQYVRTLCGFPVRYTSMPRTEDRDREEDQAWEILDRLGLNADAYFEEWRRRARRSNQRYTMATHMPTTTHAEIRVSNGTS